MSDIHVVLVAPEIHWNTGNVGRSCLAAGAKLHLIEPLGFDMDDAKLRRAGMDYRDKASVAVHADLDAWRAETNPSRVFAFTVDADAPYTDVHYREGDTLLFGPESVGLPGDVQAIAWITKRLRLPMVDDMRSINLSNSAAVVVYEAWRQLGFGGAISTTCQ